MGKSFSTFGHPLLPFLYSEQDYSPMGKVFRFMHCADLHLGARFKGLGQDNGEMAERMRKSVMESFERIIDISIDRSIDALVISGDVYDDSNELPSTRAWFSNQLDRLDVPVYICRGNHDSATSWDGAIAYPENVHEFGTEPEKIEITDGVEIVGISYSTSHETRNLASMLEGSGDKFTIACIHCDLDSVSEGYPYAPCKMSDLIGKSVDYWALGHIHKREIVSTSPYVVYPGNIQGRSFKETGQKGAYLVTVSEGRVSSLDFIPTSKYRWEDLSVDITGKNLNEIIKDLSGKVDRSSVCRLTFVGSGDLDTMLRTKTSDVSSAISSSTGCTISSIKLNTISSIDLESRSDGKDMAAAIVRSGNKIMSMSKEQIVDIICQNRNAAKYRDIYMSMTEEEIRSIVSDSMRSIIAKMEVA